MARMPDAQPAVSVVVPTYREAGNLPALTRRLFAATRAAGLKAELIFADDDSQDGSVELIEETMVGRSSSEGLGLDLENAVEQLPEKARVIFLLHDVEGYTHEELARMLGIEDGTSKSQLFRARRKLREYMRGTP